MRLSAKVRRAPGRLAAGSYILNSGLSKLSTDDQAAVGLHAMATASYPALKRISPKLFTMILAGAEISLGTALLLPVVPTATAGLGLAAFSGGAAESLLAQSGYALAGEPSAHRRRPGTGQRHLDAGNRRRIAC
jgi:uncharacterized membrane protein YphA (DoxX/SURF4 family)